jgi:hypothetical protein
MLQINHFKRYSSLIFSIGFWLNKFGNCSNKSGLNYFVNYFIYFL